MVTIFGCYSAVYHDSARLCLLVMWNCQQINGYKIYNISCTSSSITYIMYSHEHVWFSLLFSPRMTANWIFYVFVCLCEFSTLEYSQQRDSDRSSLRFGSRCLTDIFLYQISEVCFMGSSLSYDAVPEYCREFLFYKRNVQNLSQKTVDQYYLDMKLFFQWIADENSVRSPSAEIPYDGRFVPIEIVKKLTFGDLLNYLQYTTSERDNHSRARARKI